MLNKKLKKHCKTCGKIFYVFKNLREWGKNRGINAGKFCSRVCFYRSPERSPCKGKFGKESFGWKGGKVIRRGYSLIYMPTHPNKTKAGYVLEHRLIMEKHLGRYLKSDEVVHHINGDRGDSRIENLQIMHEPEHHSLHLKEFWDKKRICPNCGFIMKLNQEEGK